MLQKLHDAVEQVRIKHKKLLEDVLDGAFKTIKADLAELDQKVAPLRCKGCGILVGSGHITKRVNKNGICDLCEQYRKRAKAKKASLATSEDTEG